MSEQQYRILVVEGDALSARRLERDLLQMGYAVTGMASSAAEAVMLVLAQHHDLVLMATRLSGQRDGIDAAHTIRSQTNIPILFLGDTANAGAFERAKRVSPCAYLVKPVGQNELRVAIELALHRQVFAKSTRERGVGADGTSEPEQDSALQQALASVAHRINNPLTVVLGNTERCLARLRGTDAPNVAQLLSMLDDVRDATLRVREVVRELVQMSGTGQHATNTNASR